ncbi:LysR family transcriptional regulator [Pollutimonas nitritireducens]|uniref:LysR family transcriptional regulator n=1 Tax=Pollutimonas nitritireducens TaxID=2045209 RepID=A0A2N4UBC7_9BURK|nr:LysR family transcriptional regulator [Pollutimonas nitritireducens]PLC52326.1 LysR family transcriptional regulator [Pollutimonas nitritireducens]
MDIRSLRYFVETTRLNSFTHAAASLQVTQSTISKMIRQLEDEIGEPLLLRESRQFTLTDTGRVVYERAKDVLGAMRQLTTEVRETQALSRGTLHVGVPPMINLLFTQVLKTFRTKYPDIVLALHENTGQEIERQVAAGTLEIGMSILPTNPDLGLRAVEVASHAVWAVGEHGAFKQKNTIRLDALADMPLVLLKDDFALTRRLRHEFRQVGFEPKIAAQSSQWDWTLAMARAGMGVALLPEPFISNLNQDNLAVARIAEPDIPWQVAHIWNGRYLSHAARAWIDICEQVLGGHWLDTSDQWPSEGTTPRLSRAP